MNTEHTDLNTDSNSLYYTLRMQGLSDKDAQEQCATQESEDMMSRLEHQNAELDTERGQY